MAEAYFTRYPVPSGRLMVGIESASEELSFEVSLVDLPIDGVCSGSCIQWSELMAEEDRRKLRAWTPGDRVELVLRRKCPHG